MIAQLSNQHHDAAIDDLEALIKDRLGSRVRDFRLRASAQGLVLLGHVTSYYAKQLAQHTVMDVTTALIVANEIEVDVDFAST